MGPLVGWDDIEVVVEDLDDAVDVADEDALSCRWWYLF